MKRFVFGTVAVLAAFMGVSSMAHGAAALANGAQTSAKPTAKDAAKKQIQIAADPIGITDFQFTLQFDPNILHVALDPDSNSPLIRAINGYELGVRSDPLAEKFLIDAINGFVTVRGYWPAVGGAAVPDYEIDVYDVMFELNGGIPLETQFTINALGVYHDTRDFGNDFMNAGEVREGQVVVTRTYGVNEIITSTTGLISIATVPAPTASAAVMPAVAILLRRRQEAV